MCKQRHVILLVLFFLSASLWAQAPEEKARWSLPPIVGHAPGVWSTDADNWAWRHGNPLSRDGATWSVGIQSQNNPSPTAPFELMKKGLAWNYNFVWRDGLKKSDPHFSYMQKTLAAKAATGLSKSPASVICFTPPDTGRYQVIISGKASMAAKTAGYCRLQILLLSDKGKQADIIHTQNLNSHGGYGDYPEAFKWESDVTFKVDAKLMVRVQTISPGPATAGKSLVTFTQFDIIGQKPKTQTQQSMRYQMPMDDRALAQWQLPDGVQMEIDSQGGQHGKPALLLTFDKPIVKPVLIRGPAIHLGQPPLFATHRQLGILMHVQAHGMTDDAFEVRAMTGNKWVRAATPHRTFDTIIHLLKRHDWEQWTKVVQSGHLPQTTSKARLCFRVSSPTGKGKIKIDRLTVYHKYTVNHLIHSGQLGHIFTKPQGLLSIRPAYPDQMLDGHVQLLDELGNVIAQQAIESGVETLDITLPMLGYYKVLVDARYRDGSQIHTQTHAAVIGSTLDEAVRRQSRYGVMRVHGSEDWAVKTGSNLDWGFWKIKHMTRDAEGQPQVSGNSGWKSRLFRIWAMTDVLPAWLESPHPKQVHGLYPPRDWALFEKSIEAWARACDPLPDIVTVYNEPDAHWRGTKQELVRFVQTFARAVKRVRPEAVIGGPGFYSIRMDEFKQYVRAGILQQMDCLVIHAYVNATQPEGDFIERVTELKRYLQSIGKGEMPIYLTEFGWTSPPGDWQTTVDELTKARYCARSMILSTALDIDGMVYFCGRYAKSSQGTSYAIVHSDYTPTPAYAAFATLLRQMSTICEGGRWLRLSPVVNWVGFNRQSEYLVAAWNTAGLSTLDLPAKPLQIVDMCGKTIPTTGRTVNLSPSPIYITFQTNPLGQLVSEPSKQLMPGATMPLQADGMILAGDITYDGHELKIFPQATLGKYEILLKRGQSWSRQPLEVHGPFSMTIDSSYSSRQQPMAQIQLRCQSIASEQINAQLVFDVPGLDLSAQTVHLPARQSVKQTLALPDIEMGKRYQGKVTLTTNMPIPWQVSQPVDVTYAQCSVITRSPTEKIWQQIQPIDISAWSPWPDPIQPTDCAASYRMLAAPDGLYIQVSVQDDEHVASPLGDAMWMEDSIQIAFDVDATEPWQPNNVGNGLNGHRVTEFGLALPDTGEPVAWCWRAYVPGLRQGLNESLMQQTRITRDPMTRQTLYTTCFNWAILGLKQCPSPGKQIGFSLVVNDKDTKTPRHALRFFNGILDGKDATQYGKMKLVSIKQASH